MTEIDIDAIRARVSAAARVDPATGDSDFDEFSVSSLLTFFNRIAPGDVALPTEGFVTLQVSTHAGGRLPAHAQGELESAVARAIAFVGAAIAHPDADVSRLGAQSLRQSIVYTRPTPTGAIAFVPERHRAIPGFSSETVAERAMTRLASILPSGPEDLALGTRLLALRQPERRAVSEIAKAARPTAGLSMVLLGQDDVVSSTVTPNQADNIDDLLDDIETHVEPMPPVIGRLDGMRFSRQMFFLQPESGPDRQGVIDEDLLPTAKELLDRRVVAHLERVTVRKRSGTKGRSTYRLVNVELAEDDGLF